MSRWTRILLIAVALPLPWAGACATRSLDEQASLDARFHCAVGAFEAEEEIEALRLVLYDWPEVNGCTSEAERLAASYYGVQLEKGRRRLLRRPQQRACHDRATREYIGWAYGVDFLPLLAAEAGCG